MREPVKSPPLGTSQKKSQGQFQPFPGQTLPAAVATPSHFNLADIPMLPHGHAESGVIQRAKTRSALGDARAPWKGRDTAGQPLPSSVRELMESAFGADFAKVRIHQGDTATSVSALAYTRGDNIHFGPGHYSPHSPAGKALLGHELTHVIQQRAGRVAGPQARHSSGATVNADPALENEAEQLGARAARGERVVVPGGHSIPPASPPPAAGGVIQRAAILVGKETDVNGKHSDLWFESRRKRLEAGADAIGSGTPMKFFYTTREELPKDRTIYKVANCRNGGDKIGKSDHIDIFGHSYKGDPGGVRPDKLIAGIKANFVFDLQPNEKWKGDMRMFSCFAASSGGGADANRTINELGKEMSQDAVLGGVQAVGGPEVKGSVRPTVGFVVARTEDNLKLRNWLKDQDQTKRPGDFTGLQNLIVNKSLNDVRPSSRRIPKILKLSELAFTEDDKEQARNAVKISDLQAIIVTAFNRVKGVGWRVARPDNRGKWKSEDEELVGQKTGQITKIAAIPVEINGVALNADDE